MGKRERDEEELGASSTLAISQNRKERQRQQDLSKREAAAAAEYAEEEEDASDSDSEDDASDDDSDDNAMLGAGAGAGDEEEEEAAAADPLHLPRLLLAFAEDVLAQTERDVALDAGDAWQQAHAALDKAQLLLLHHQPQLQTLLDDALARQLSAGDSRVPPGSKDVRRSRQDIRYLLCMIYTARAKLLAAAALNPAIPAVRTALQAALVYFPRCTQALLLLSQAERALCTTAAQLAAVESLLRKAVTAVLVPVQENPAGGSGSSSRYVCM